MSHACVDPKGTAPCLGEIAFQHMLLRDEEGFWTSQINASPSPNF